MTAGLDALTRVGDITVTYGAGTINVKLFPYFAVGDGATDDTVAIQAAIDAAVAAGGGYVFFPRGIYKVTGLIVDGSFVRLIGEGWASRIAMASATGDTLLFDNGVTGVAIPEDTTYLTGCGVENVRFEPGVTRTAGAEIKALRFNKIYLNDLVINSCYQGIILGRSTDLCITAYINNLRLRTYFIGVRSQRVIEMWGSGWALDTNNVTAGATGIKLAGGNEGFNLVNFDVVNSHPDAQWGTLVTDIYSFHLSNEGTPTDDRHNKFSNGFFDSHAIAVLVEDGSGNDFINVYHQAHRWMGIKVTGTAQNTRWIGGGAFVCGTDGVFIDTDGRGIGFYDFSSLNNNINGASPFGNGFTVVGTGGWVDIVNCKAGRDDGSVNALVGIMNNAVLVGADVTNLLVEGCDLNFWAGAVNGAYNIIGNSETNRYINNKTQFGVGDYVRVFHDASQAITVSGTPQNLVFNTDRSDPNTMHDTASNTDRLVAHAPGFYKPEVGIQWASNSTGYRQVAFVRYNADGSTPVYFGIHQTLPLSGQATIQCVTCPPFFMLAEQFVKIEVLQTSGGSLNVESASAWSPEAALTKVG